MVSTVITFSKTDIQGPVYVAGSFTEWSPVEMNCESTASGQNKFSYTTDLNPGKYQYKFRLGPGDWWVLDESTSTENDGAGNINNVLAVEAEAEVEAKAEATTKSPSMPAEEPAQAVVSAPDAGEESTRPLSTHNMVTAVEDELEVRADDGPQDVQGLDVHKEDHIPDVAPPPYSVEEHAAAQAAEDAQIPSVPDIIGALKEKMSPEVEVPKENPPRPKTPETKSSGLLQNVLLVAAIVAVPVAFAYFLRR